jgi:hypothetical protein
MVNTCINSQKYGQGCGKSGTKTWYLHHKMWLGKKIIRESVIMCFCKDAVTSRHRIITRCLNSGMWMK